MIPASWIAFGLGAALLTASAGGYLKGRADVQAKWDVARFKADAEAAEARAASLAVARAKEAAWNDVKTKLEAQTRERENTIHGLRIANGRLLSATGGLFDRNGRPVSGNGVSCAPITAGQPPGAPAGCELSRTVSEALLDLALDADRAAVYAQTCRAWVIDGS